MMEWIKSNWRYILLGLIAFLAVVAMLAAGKQAKQVKQTTIPDDAIIIRSVHGQKIPVSWISREFDLSFV
jgi:hypothetical protein